MIEKILFLATVDSHIYYFHIPFMKLLRDMGYDVEVAAGPSEFKEKIEEEGFKVYPLPFSRNPLSFSNVKVFFVLLNLMKQQKYVMVHTHTPVASFVGRIAAKIAGVPHIVYTAHGFHFHEYGSEFRNFIYYRLERFAGRFTDVLITINEDDYKIAKERNIIPNGRVVYIKGVGVDTEKLNPQKFSFALKMEYRSKLGLNRSDFLVIVVAELIKRKNLNDIIMAIKLAKERKYPIRLLIAGDGVMEQQLKDLVFANDLDNDVFFLGRRSDVPELLYISDVLVMTSLHEGLPRAVMEAMAMEKPVVAYNIRGVRELVVDGETGFLVKFGDVGGLADKIIFLMDHPDIAKEMGVNGREKIEHDFSLEIILKKMKNIYKEFLES